MNDFFDKELGPVVVKRNNRAKRVIVRRKHDVVEMTVPTRLTNTEIKKHFDNLKPQILNLPIQKIVKITEESNIEASTFKVVIDRQPSYSDRAGVLLEDGILKLGIPPQYDINSDDVQWVIKDLIIYGLRYEAKRILPRKVLFLAKKHGLKVNEIKINSSKKRWGSCTNRKNINLSLFLMMLPEHLINYVILHELAHTIELNHSPRFWQILDVFCDGKAQELDHECTYWTTDYLYCLKQ